MSEPTDPREKTVQRMLYGTIAWVGVVVILFGLSAYFSGQEVPGLIIIAIGVVDLIGLIIVRRYLLAG